MFITQVSKLYNKMEGSFIPDRSLTVPTITHNVPSIIPLPLFPLLHLTLNQSTGFWTKNRQQRRMRLSLETLVYSIPLLCCWCVHQGCWPQRGSAPRGLVVEYQFYHVHLVSVLYSIYYLALIALDLFCAFLILSFWYRTESDLVT